MLLFRLVLASAFITASVLFVASAYAAPTTSTTSVDLGPAAQFALELLIQLAPFIAVILAGFASWALGKLGLKQDAQQGEIMRMRLEALLNSGVNLAKSRLQTKFNGHLSVDVHNELLATVSAYVLEHGSAVSKYYVLNKNRDILTEKAEAWLAAQGLVPSATGVVQVPDAVPVPAGAIPVQPRIDLPPPLMATTTSIV
jgi:hypothetical protein